MNKKTLWGVIGLIIIVLIVWAAKGGSSREAHVIKIGVVAPMTGGAAGYGLPLTKGIELAHKDLAGVHNEYQVIFEDDGTNPAASASAAQKLINVDKVSAVITTTSGTGNSVKPIATAAGIPHICICVDTRIADNKTNFLYDPLPDLEAKIWVQEAIKNGAKKFALLSQNQPGFNLLVENTKKEIAAQGGTIVFEERFDPAIKDFKTVLAKAVATKPDIYLAAAFSPSLDVLGKELNGLKIKNYAGMGTFAASPDPSIFEGAWFTDASLSDSAFQSRFQSAFPDVRFNVRSAPQGYDAFNLLVRGFEKGNDPAAYIAGLTSYEGKVGKATKAEEFGAFNLPIGIWKIEGGNAVQVK